MGQVHHFQIVLIVCTAAALASETISLQEFLEHVQKGHPFFQKEALAPQIAKKAQERLLGRADWTLSAQPSFCFQLEDESSDLYTARQKSDLDVSIKAQKPFWNTGGRMSLVWTSGYLDRILADPVLSGFPDGRDRQYNHGAYIGYCQPLLHNAGGRLDRLEHDQAKYAIATADIQAQEHQETYLLELGLRFLDWVQLSEQVSLAKEFHLMFKGLLNATKIRKRAKRATHADVLRVGDAERQAEQELASLEAQWKALQAELATRGNSAKLYDQEPMYSLTTLEELPSLVDADKRIKDLSRVLRLLDQMHKGLSRRKHVLAEASRPQLNLHVLAGVTQQDSIAASSVQLVNPDARVGLEFKHVLGNRSVQADLDRTQMEMLRLELEIRNAVLEIKGMLRNLMVRANGLACLIKLDRRQAVSARQKSEEESRQYNQGRGEMVFVILARQHEYKVKNAHIENVVAYKKLVLQYHAVMDELLPSQDKPAGKAGT